MRDLAEAEPVSSRSYRTRRIVILPANFYDACMLLLPIMGVSSEGYHVNAQAQSVPRQSDVPASRYIRFRISPWADNFFHRRKSGGSEGIQGTEVRGS